MRNRERVKKSTNKQRNIDAEMGKERGKLK